jgi:NitT/TauT family transport system substrate-binding protein
MFNKLFITSHEKLVSFIRSAYALTISAVISAAVLTGCGTADTIDTDSAANSVTSETTSDISSDTSSSEDADSSELTLSSDDSIEIYDDPEDIAEYATKIAALKGPTAMGLAPLMDKSDNAESDGLYSFQLEAAPDAIAPLIAKKDVDIACVPANLASVLYNSTEGQIQVLAVNTLGVLYMVSNGEDVSSVHDLKGKTIYASGKGATPEYTLDYILSKNGLDPDRDVTIEWKSEHAECVAAIAKNGGIAMLPQPFVTAAMLQNDKIKTVLDLTEEWKKVSDGHELIMGVVIARRDYAENNKDTVDDFLREYKDSVDFVNSNADKASELIGKYDIVPAPVAKKAIPECNITFIDGDQMKTELSAYLKTLYDADPKAVGGALPGDDFYY